MFYLYSRFKILNTNRYGFQKTINLTNSFKTCHHIFCKIDLKQFFQSKIVWCTTPRWGCNWSCIIGQLLTIVASLFCVSNILRPVYDCSSQLSGSDVIERIKTSEDWLDGLEINFVIIVQRNTCISVEGIVFRCYPDLKFIY